MAESQYYDWLHYQNNLLQQMENFLNGLDSFYISICSRGRKGRKQGNVPLRQTYKKQESGKFSQLLQGEKEETVLHRLPPHVGVTANLENWSEARRLELSSRDSSEQRQHRPLQSICESVAEAGRHTSTLQSRDTEQTTWSITGHNKTKQNIHVVQWLALPPPCEK